jgi:hypothetical protein
MKSSGKRSDRLSVKERATLIRVVAHKQEMKRRRERYEAFMHGMKIRLNFNDHKMLVTAVEDLAWKAFNEGCRRDDSN